MLRLLGFIFLIILLLAGVGYFRGWYSFGAVQAGGRTGVTVDFDNEKISKDASAAADTFGELSALAVQQVKRLAGTDEAETVIQGEVVAVDPETRTLQLQAGGEVIELSVPQELVLLKDGAPAAFEELHVGGRLEVGLQRHDDKITLARIALH